MVPVLVALGSFVTTLAGGFAALRFRDYRHLILGLAAGLMLGVVAFDLVPEALSQQPGELFGVQLALLAAVVGFLTLHVVERSVAIHRAHEAEYAGHLHAPGVGLFAGSALVGHSVMDGFAIGAAFQAGSTVGVVVSIAVLSHDFADGFNTYQEESWMLDSPEGVCPGQARLEYPATSVLFSNFTSDAQR
jgi:zinc transporter ZupT